MLGKIPTKKVLLIVWTKLNFWCTALQKAKKVHWKQWNNTLDLRKQVRLKIPFLRKLTSRGCSRSLSLRKQLTYQSEWVHKPYWEKMSTIPRTPKSKVPEKLQFQFHVKKVIRIESIVCCTSRGELETMFEKLTLVRRYFQLKVFLKMPHFSVFRKKSYSHASTLKNFGKVTGVSVNYVGKTIRRKLGINLKKMIFSKKSDFRK